MQFAITVSPTETKPVQAGPDAPRYAQCVYCGMPVELICYLPDNPSVYRSAYAYNHTSDLATSECQKLRDSGQAELDKVLNVNR